MRYRKQKIIILILMICSISYLHYTTKMHQPFVHLIHRELYLVPIILSAYWFGKRGGLTVSIIASVLFLPWTLMTTPGETTYHIINLLHILMFNFIAYFVGIYHDAKLAHFGLDTSKRQDANAVLPDHGRNVLLCINDSPNAIKAAKYLADSFSSCQEISVSVLGILRQPSADLYASQEAWERAKENNQILLSSLTERARSILSDAGVSSQAIEISTLSVENESLAAKILERQRKDGFDAIVIGATRMSKAQEFLFGNTAVKLVREADCPVIVVN